MSAYSSPTAASPTDYSPTSTMSTVVVSRVVLWPPEGTGYGNGPDPLTLTSAFAANVAELVKDIFTYDAKAEAKRLLTQDGIWYARTRLEQHPPASRRDPMRIARRAPVQRRSARAVRNWRRPTSLR